MTAWWNSLKEMLLSASKAGLERFQLVFSHPDNTPLLDATALEIFQLFADPVNKQLTPAPRIRARFF